MLINRRQRINILIVVNRYVAMTLIAAVTEDHPALSA